MGDDDLIRRGDALNCLGNMSVTIDRKAIEALPAVMQPVPDAAAIREAALMTVPDEIELYYIIKASGAKKRIDVARAVSAHLEPMRRAILALITEKPHDRA